LSGGIAVQSFYGVAFSIKFLVKPINDEMMTPDPNA
jgi:hypothetical protein